MHLSLFALHTLWSDQWPWLAGFVLRENAVKVADRELRSVRVVEPDSRDALTPLMELLDGLHLSLALIWHHLSVREQFVVRDCVCEVFLHF